MFDKIFRNWGKIMNNINISNSNVDMRKGNNNITVNGRTISVGDCNNLSIINGKVFIDGKEFKHDNFTNKEIVNITIEGNVGKLDCGGSVTVNGNVEDYIDCGGSVTVTGEVNGGIDCGGSCTIKGNHTGRIDAGGSVTTR